MSVTDAVLLLDDLGLLQGLPGPDLPGALDKSGEIYHLGPCRTPLPPGARFSIAELRTLQEVSALRWADETAQQEFEEERALHQKACAAFGGAPAEALALVAATGRDQLVCARCISAVPVLADLDELHNELNIAERLRSLVTGTDSSRTWLDTLRVLRMRCASAEAALERLAPDLAARAFYAVALEALREGVGELEALLAARLPSRRERIRHLLVLAAATPPALPLALEQESPLRRALTELVSPGVLAFSFRLRDYLHEDSERRTRLATELVLAWANEQLRACLEGDAPRSVRVLGRVLSSRLIVVEERLGSALAELDAAFLAFFDLESDPDSPQVAQLLRPSRGRTRNDLVGSVTLLLGSSNADVVVLPETLATELTRTRRARPGSQQGPDAPASDLECVALAGNLDEPTLRLASQLCTGMPLGRALRTATAALVSV